MNDSISRAAALRAIEELPSVQPKRKVTLLEALDTIELFLKSCICTTTSTIITPDGEKLVTDWGYFEEGLNEIAQYAYGHKTTEA